MLKLLPVVNAGVLVVAAFVAAGSLLGSLPGAAIPLEGEFVLGVLEPGASMLVGSTLAVVENAVVGASSAVLDDLIPFLSSS